MKINYEKNGILNKDINKRYLEFVLEKSSDVFWIINSKPESVDVSNSIEYLTGFSKAEFLSFQLDEILSEKSFHILKSRILNIADNEIQSNSFIIEIKTKSSQRISCKISLGIVNSGEEEVSGIICLYIDYSSILKIEEYSNNENKKNLEARNFKSLVLGILTHEFKTPLNGIMGYTKLLAKDNHTEDNKEMLDYIHQSAQRLNATLNSVTTLAAIESDRMNLRSSLVNINEAIQLMYLNFEQTIKAKEIDFKINIDELIVIKSDEDCINQILHHILDNAVKFTQNGSINISAELITDSSQKYVKITVTDTGIGIDSNYINSIFEPFRQASEGIDRSFDGLGIGLTITEKLVEKLNGSIKVVSELHQGTSIILNLPFLK